MRNSHRCFCFLVCLLISVLFQGQTAPSPSKPPVGPTSSGAKPAAGNKGAEASKLPPGNPNAGGPAGSDKNSADNASKDQLKTDTKSPALPSQIKYAIVPPTKDHGSTDLEKLQGICTSKDRPPLPTVGLNDNLVLCISLSDGQIHDPDGAQVKPEDLKLMINGITTNDQPNTPSFSWFVTPAAKDTIGFITIALKRTDSSKDAWNKLLAQKLRSHSVQVAVTGASKKPFPGTATFNLQVMRVNWYLWVLVGLIIILLIMLLTNNRLREMLRDDGDVKNGGKAAYSLARVQMFYWFVIVVGCYIFIWIITGDRDTVTNDALALIGISAGTFLGAVSIDSAKKAQAQSQLPDATAKLDQVNATAASIAAQTPNTPSSTTANQAVAAQQRAVYNLTCQTLADRNVHFIADILSDANGLSFHRFQIVAWSLVLGVIFIASVFQTLSMPTFGNTLLGLMGISGGTYLGFKFPEQKTP